jgi:hypothetical protein
MSGTGFQGAAQRLFLRTPEQRLRARSAVTALALGAASSRNPKCATDLAHRRATRYARARLLARIDEAIRLQQQIAAPSERVPRRPDRTKDLDGSHQIIERLVGVFLQARRGVDAALGGNR